MKLWFSQKLNLFAVWILRKTGGWPVLVNSIVTTLSKINEEKEKEIPAYTKRAYELVKEYDTLQASGEYKRHQIYSKLIKEFPEVSKKDLALSIELGVQKL